MVEFVRKYWRYLLPIFLSVLLAAYRRYDLVQHGWKVAPSGERLL